MSTKSKKRSKKRHLVTPATKARLAVLFERSAAMVHRKGLTVSMPITDAAVLRVERAVGKLLGRRKTGKRRGRRS